MDAAIGDAVGRMLAEYETLALAAPMVIAQLWFVADDPDDPDFVRALLAAPSLRSAVPELRLPAVLPPVDIFGQPVPADLGFVEIAPIALADELFGRLAGGSAYRRYGGRHGAEICVDAVAALDVDGCRVYRSRAAWTDFFSASADSTWVAVDDARDRIVLICVSDID